jgi:phospholipid-binding lipoprotein MlaA
MERISPTISAQWLLLLIILAVLLAGCGVHRADIAQPVAAMEPQDDTVAPLDDDEFGLEAEFENAAVAPPIDPLSGYNRVMTQFNDRCYLWLLKPVAHGYRAVLPEGARLAVGRFFRNLLMPVRFTNNLLQLKPKRAGTELVRFALNSTVGVLGLGDPAAKRFDLQAYPEDFGQTLGYYGVGGGFHLVLPLLGPSNLRDTLGIVPDYYLDPVSYFDAVNVELAVSSYDLINQTSLHLGEYESLKKDAIDLYPFFRDGYEQRRIKLIEE